MTQATSDQAATESGRLIDKGLDALRQVSSLSHEARAPTSAAAEAVVDGVQAVQRTASSVRQDALDVRNEVSYRVKREPIKALGIAFAVGTLAGLLLAICRPRRTRHQDVRETEC